MDLAVFLLAFAVSWKLSSSLHCYKCEPEPVTYREPLCEHFDYSDKYLTECKSSTMCYKKEISLLGSDLKVFERGCAMQTMSGDQEKKNGKWQKSNRIYEVYEETCQEDLSNAERVTKTIHCYCRGDYCNSARPVTGNYIAVLTVAIVSAVMS